MSRVRLLASAAGLALAAASPALAQQAPRDREVSEVVVSAAPYVVTLDSATTSVDILRRDDIDQAPAGGVGYACIRSGEGQTTAPSVSTNRSS